MTNLEYSLKLEALAWQWLLSFERLDYKTHSKQVCDRQVSITAIPGSLDGHPGPIVRVLVSHPQVEGRIDALGSSLAGAARQIWGKLIDKGIKMDIPPDLLRAPY